MCEIEVNAALDAAIINAGLNLIGMAMEAYSRENTPTPDVLAAATTAYQQGKITKAQYFAVVNALDEPTTVQTAWVQRSSSIIRR